VYIKVNSDLKFVVLSIYVYIVFQLFFDNLSLNKEDFILNICDVISKYDALLSKKGACADKTYFIRKNINLEFHS
jgi:hypothetical protein